MPPPLDRVRRRPVRAVRTTGLALALAALAGTAGAAELEWLLDPARSLVRFTLGARLHTVEGTITVREGTLRFPEEGGPASGRIVLDATSAQTGNRRRDANMHGDVLESARYPEIVFEASELRRGSPAGDASAAEGFPVALVGELSIHGVKVPVTIDAVVRREGTRAEVSGSFVAPYVDWGLEYVGNFLLPIEKETRIDVEAVGRLRTPEPGS